MSEWGEPAEKLQERIVKLLSLGEDAPRYAYDLDLALTLPIRDRVWFMEQWADEYREWRVWIKSPADIFAPGESYERFEVLVEQPTLLQAICYAWCWWYDEDMRGLHKEKDEIGNRLVRAREEKLRGRQKSDE